MTQGLRRYCCKPFNALAARLYRDRLTSSPSQPRQDSVGELKWGRIWGWFRRGGGLHSLRGVFGPRMVGGRQSNRPSRCLQPRLQTPVGPRTRSGFRQRRAEPSLGRLVAGDHRGSPHRPPFSAYWGNASQVCTTAARVRPDASGGYQSNGAWRDNARGEKFFNTSVFHRPARFMFGELGRIAFIAPGALCADLSIIKDMRMPWEGHTVQFRGEVINLPSRANFGLPVGNVQNRAFGNVTGLTVGASGASSSSACATASSPSN